MRVRVALVRRVRVALVRRVSVLVRMTCALQVA